jgi:uncharacterized protein with GYD domain
VALFVVQHRHEADRCPARNPQAGQMLLQHLSSSKSFGITIHGEAVVNGAHTLYLIVDAPDRESANRFMNPFKQAGTVEILPASPCESVIARGGCGSA